MIAITPIPVSAFILSSILLTAGVCWLIRFSPSIQLKVECHFTVGISVDYVTGLGENLQHDLMNIIALSHLRQLTLMMQAMSANVYEKRLYQTEPCLYLGVERIRGCDIQ